MSFRVTQPPLRSKFDKENGVNTEWAEWCKKIYTVASSVSQSGSTRPPALYVGQMFFDESLGTQGKPIWVGSDGSWRLSDGTAA